MIVPGDASISIAAGAICIRSGGLLGLPTETVYGLAADADNAAAVALIFELKGRPSEHPLIVHVANINCVEHFAVEVPDFARQLMIAFWPGPLTLILPRRPGVASAAAGGNHTVGLRCPSHPVAQALLRSLINWGQSPINSKTIPQSGKKLESDPNLVWGLAAPSANHFGRVSPTTARHVRDEFGDELLILDGGACTVGIESTIVDCTRGAPILLRPGAITPLQVQGVCSLKVLLESELLTLAAPAPNASGTLESHYAPKARVRLMKADALQTALDVLGTGADARQESPFIAIYSRAILQTCSKNVLRRRMPDDAPATARQLFAVLREFDAQDVKLIWIETPPDTPEWAGVRDRLQRASAV